MSETGTCLLLEGEKVREMLVSAYRASLIHAFAVGPEDTDRALAMTAKGDPAALALAYGGVMMVTELFHRHLFGEELKGALSDGD